LPVSSLERVFLDANVLYSAAYLGRSGLARLWTLQDVELVTSAYAIEEARRNLATDHTEALARLERFTKAIVTVDAPQGRKLPNNIRLDPKDQPILLAALHAHADYLLTGDARHFEHLYGKRIETVLVLRPAQYFARRLRP
jgi:predicted nucleic acid-binding protein